MLTTLLLTSLALADEPCDDACIAVAELRRALAASTVTAHRPTEGKLQAVYDANLTRIQAGIALTLSDGQRWDLDQLTKTWAQHKATYEAVAAQANVPAELVAALHHRESSADFTTYLHQGDPLGAAAVRVPKDIPVFQVDEWDQAAVHALKQKDRYREQLGITAATTDLTALATYAERYNGLGYYNQGTPSAYVFAGTSAYTGGKYVADHEFSKTAVDKQLGVYAMITHLQGSVVVATAAVAEPAEAKPERRRLFQGWFKGRRQRR